MLNSRLLGTFRNHSLHRFGQLLSSIAFSSVSTPELSQKIVVFGGSGFVGQSVCKAALSLHCDVVSINRRGVPDLPPPWASSVKWVKGDIFNPEEYLSELKDAIGVVSCVGAFGSNAFMERICGDATITAAETAFSAGVQNFVFISAAGSDKNHFLLQGYYKGKLKAENTISRLFPASGVCLRPGGIYGDRVVQGVKVPLGLVFKPLEKILNLGGPFKVLQQGPLEAVFTPPVDVCKVGKVAGLAALGRTRTGILHVDDINSIASDT